MTRKSRLGRRTPVCRMGAFPRISRRDDHQWNAELGAHGCRLRANPRRGWWPVPFFPRGDPGSDDRGLTATVPILSALKPGVVAGPKLEHLVSLSRLRAPEEVPDAIRKFHLRDRPPLRLMAEASFNLGSGIRLRFRRNCPPRGVKAHDAVWANLPSSETLAQFLLRARPGLEAAVRGEICGPILP